MRQGKVAVSKLYSKTLRRFLIGQEDVTAKDVDGFDELVKRGFIEEEEQEVPEKKTRKKQVKKTEETE